LRITTPGVLGAALSLDLDVIGQADPIANFGLDVGIGLNMQMNVASPQAIFSRVAGQTGYF